MEKKELIQKLIEARNIYVDAKCELKRIYSLTVEDKYKRTVVVPNAPVKPKEVKKETKQTKTYGQFDPNGSRVKNNLGGYIFLGIVAGLFSACLMYYVAGIKEYGFFKPFAIFEVIMIILMILAWNGSVKSSENKYKDYVKKTKLENEVIYNDYLIALKAYDIQKDNYDNKVKEKEKEESEIQEKLKNDLNDLRKQEIPKLYNPLMKQFREAINGVISESYCDDLDEIIKSLESGRADNMKEALNVLEEDKFRRSQLDLERQRIANENLDRARERAMLQSQHDESMRQQKAERERAERRRQEEIERQERMHEESMRLARQQYEDQKERQEAQRKEDLAREKAQRREDKERSAKAMDDWEARYRRINQ